eukprot:Seg123.3 transcript_id=Seg123.3/GoldUCD/mRNA.D3Y31 product="hypothetical protein" protein_id=Seg123.3/GoldUCD/D3Y31
MGSADASTSNANELNKFTKLCSEVECGLATSYSSLDEVLMLKDVLLEQSLPSSVKIKMTLALGRLHRSMSDFSVPTREMTRLVRLYAVPWENKSKALKKLHQDYESKQHQLEIALKRLEMVGVQTMRMEKERRILNWEKLFAKLVGGKGHGQRWRFLIHQFKQKVKNGEDIAAIYSTISDEEDDEVAEEKESIRKKSNLQFAQELREKLHKFEVFPQETSPERKQSSGRQNVAGSSLIEEESEASFAIGMSDNNSSVSIDLENAPVSSRKKVRFDDGEQEIGEKGKEEQAHGNAIKVDAEIKQKIEVIPKEMADKDCWTHEPEYEKLFHIRMYKPVCKTLSSSWCTLAFDKEVRKTQVFKGNEEKEKEGKKSEVPEVPEEKPAVNLTPSSDPNIGSNRNASENGKGKDKEEIFQEFSFKLSPEFEARNKEDIVLKFSVHPENKKTMVAMTSVKFSDLIIVKEENLKSSPKEVGPVKLTGYPIRATINNSELIFNRPCGEIKMVCYHSKVTLPRLVTRGTETLSIEELTNRIIELRRKEFLKRLKSAGTSMSEKPIYTEEQMKTAKEELKKELLNLRDEYEERLGLLISQLNKENSEDLREFVNAATSPLFMWSSSNMNELSDDPFWNTNMQPVKPISRKSPKKTVRQKAKQQIWGENLPEDFYERMEMFKEESTKHHQKLKEKINEQVERDLERKLASQNKLDAAPTNGIIQEEVSLPALFMPSKTRNLYTPKARSYFHAFGTNRDRLTQAPSILQLPHLKTNHNADVIGIYETVMKQKMDKADADEIDDDTDMGRFSAESSTSIEIPGEQKEDDEDDEEMDL